MWYIQFEIQFNSYAIVYMKIHNPCLAWYIYIKMHFSKSLLSVCLLQNKVLKIERNAFLYHQTKGRHRRVSYIYLLFVFIRSAFRWRQFIYYENFYLSTI